MPLSAFQQRVLARARGEMTGGRARFNGVEENDELDGNEHRPEGRQVSEAGPSSWPPRRPNKRPRSPGTAPVIDLDAPGSQKGPKSERITLATFNGSATGITHYSGASRLSSGEIVKLKREPMNQYDANAIRVETVQGTQIGHIPRLMAFNLAPLMDAQEGIKVRAKAAAFTSPPAFNLPLVITILGKPELSNDARLAFAKPRTYQPHNVPAGYAQAGRQSKGMPATNVIGGQGLADLTQGYQQREEHRPDQLASLFSEFDPSTLPEHSQPNLKTKLLPHQLQALAYMIQQEHPRPPEDEKPVQLWQKRKDGGDFYNVASKESSESAPKLARAGILADEMGLGKTLSSIALIVSPPDGSSFLDEAQVEAVDDRYCEATLIICPVSVISNWTGQIRQHAGKKIKKVHVYHGDGRSIGRAELKECDVVVTTYHTLSAEWVPEDAPAAKKKKASRDADGDVKNGKLHRIAWRRVMLDEGHTIRNHKTQMAKACHALRAERRWILTGTPLINSPKDMGAMLYFLRSCAPLDDPARWSTIVERGFKKGVGQILLKAVVSATTLRRTKEMKGKDGQPIVKLPALKVYLHKVDLEPKAREIYDEVEKAVQNSVMRTIQQGDLQKTYSAVLVYLLRLRQIACHPSLCPEEFIEEVRASNLALPAAPVEGADQPAPAISPEQRIKLQRTLLELRYEDCSICFSAPEEPVITACSHAFCINCIQQVLDFAATQGKESLCPMCRGRVSKEMLVPLPDEPLPSEDTETEGETTEDEASIDVDKDEESILSAKSRELIRLLKGAINEGHRSLVFSQWTTHLRVIGAALEENDIDYVTFDGSMSQKKRARVIDDFQSGKGPDVMLLSIMSGGLGLNLTAASVVFLMDPWWQSSIEQQAIDRTYRIGQTKDCQVFQLICQDTVEERVLKIQATKTALIANAFSGQRGATTERQKIETRLGDVLQAFGLARDAANAPAQA